MPFDPFLLLIGTVFHPDSPLRNRLRRPVPPTERPAKRRLRRSPRPLGLLPDRPGVKQQRQLVAVLIHGRNLLLDRFQTLFRVPEAEDQIVISRGDVEGAVRNPAQIVVAVGDLGSVFRGDVVFPRLHGGADRTVRRQIPGTAVRTVRNSFIRYIRKEGDPYAPSEPHGEEEEGFF